MGDFFASKVKYAKPARWQWDQSPSAGTSAEFLISQSQRVSQEKESRSERIFSGGMIRARREIR
jgi:hypothetical protein